MMVSDAMRAANRRNAQHSTGPRTEAGKEASSRNAVRHGLTAERPVDAAEACEHAARVAAFRDLFGPGDDWQSWLVEQLAGATLRLTRIGRAEVELRADAAWRAEHLWDEDRHLEVERVGATLARQPARAVATLRRTPHGCDWLLARWEALAGAADWTPAQAELARDLLATPPEFRPDPAGAAVDAEGRAAGTVPSPAGLARAKVAELQAHRAVVAAADESARALVRAGLADAPTRDLANLRRYERAALRRLDWVQDQMDRAGLRPRAQSLAPRPTAATPTAAPAPARPPGTPPTGRVEPTPPRALGETKPLAPPAPGPPAAEPRPRRPDLDKFRRRDRRSA